MEWIGDRLEPAGHVYGELCEMLMNYGDPAEPRGQKTIELTGVRCEIDPHRPLTGRPGFSEQFALLETLQVLTGRADLHQLRRYAKKFASMAPSYVTYGPRLCWQLRDVVAKLSSDSLTRQALAAVYMPEDAQKGYPDCPCTLSLQFLLRGEELHCVGTMRSNDIWFGTPNDWYMFTFIQREVARALDVDCGTYVHQVGSFHVYEPHWNAVGDFAVPTESEVRAARPMTEVERRTSAPERWAHTLRLAANFLDHEHGHEELLEEARTWTVT